MKKLLSVLPSTLQGGFRGGLFFLALLVTTTLWAYDFESGKLYYNITSDSTVEVAQGGYSGEVIIPENVTYNGNAYSVTSIGESAFYACSLTSVTIPASVISIEEYNFYESKYIKTVYLKSTTPPILNGGKIFDTSRPTCYIPCGTLDTYKASKWANLMKQFVEECEEEGSTNIITYTSSDGKVVRPYTPVFGANIVSNEYKDGQGVITFGGPVTNIGDRAFYKCTSLTSITIPNSVTSIGSTAFSGTSITYITIPESVTSIGNQAFSHCSSLTSITIPESVANIEWSAFDNCSALTKTNYTGDIAGWCNIKFGSNDSNPMYYSHNFYINDQEIKDLVIPNTVDSIHNYAFYNCSSLTSVTIGNSVTSIGEEAFYNCIFTKENFINNSSLDAEANNYWGAKVVDLEIDGLLIRNDTVICCRPYVIAAVIPNSVTSIGNSAFSYCSSLTSITIPNSVTSIGSNAFYDCSSLPSITIPNSVTSIGNSAFSYCSALTKTNYTGDIAGWCNIKFGSDDSNPMYYSHNFYINDQEIKDLVIPNTVDSIHNYAFYNCRSLTSITIPNSVTSIGRYAFYYCRSLTSIAIPESVTNIGEGVFYRTSIDYVYVKATTPPMLNIGIYPVFSTSPTCYIPCGTSDTYKASEWSSQVSQFVEECEEDNTPTDLENTDIQYPISDTRKLLRDGQLYIYHNGSTYTIMGVEIK